MVDSSSMRTIISAPPIACSRAAQASKRSSSGSVSRSSGRPPRLGRGCTPPPRCHYERVRDVGGPAAFLVFAFRPHRTLARSGEIKLKRRELGDGLVEEFGFLGRSAVREGNVLTSNQARALNQSSSIGGRQPT